MNIYDKNELRAILFGSILILLPMIAIIVYALLK